MKFQGCDCRVKGLKRASEVKVEITIHLLIKPRMLILNIKGIHNKFGLLSIKGG